MKLLLLVTLLCVFHGISFADNGLSSVHCEGGTDGPNPLSDMTTNIAPGVSILQTKSLIKDFIFWQS